MFFIVLGKITEKFKTLNRNCLKVYENKFIIDVTWKQTHHKFLVKKYIYIYKCLSIYFFRSFKVNVSAFYYVNKHFTLYYSSI